MRFTVTIARQLGCGGSFMGQCLAENLQARCLDREIISRAAQKLALDEDELTRREEKVSTFWERMLQGVVTGPPEALYHAPTTPSISDRDLFAAETEVMKEIAAQESCVIVGRLASHVLPHHPGMVNIFLYAPLSFRVQRVMESFPATNELQARAKISQSDEARSRFLTQMIGKQWDDARNYHLCIDTSSLPLSEISDVLTGFVRRKVGAGQNADEAPPQQPGLGEG